jgi:hypothetical protein
VIRIDPPGNYELTGHDPFQEVRAIWDCPDFLLPSLTRLPPSSRLLAFPVPSRLRLPAYRVSDLPTTGPVASSSQTSLPPNPSSRKDFRALALGPAGRLDSAARSGSPDHRPSLSRRSRPAARVSG